MCQAAHLVTIALSAQTVADAGAQHPLAHLGLHHGQRGHLQSVDFMKHDPRRRVRGVDRREDPIDDTILGTGLSYSEQRRSGGSGALLLVVLILVALAWLFF